MKLNNLLPLLGIFVLTILSCQKEIVSKDKAAQLDDMPTATSTSSSYYPPEDEGCTVTQGYWKNHTNNWPDDKVGLGNVGYDQAELLLILNTPVRGNGLVSLAHQLIAAKLNIAGGASNSAIVDVLAEAKALIGNRVVPPLGSGFLSPAVTSALTEALDNYNNGLTGPGHCN